MDLRSHSTRLHSYIKSWALCNILACELVKDPLIIPYSCRSFKLERIISMWNVLLSLLTMQSTVAALAFSSASSRVKLHVSTSINEESLEKSIILDNDDSLANHHVVHELDRRTIVRQVANTFLGAYTLCAPQDIFAIDSSNEHTNTFYRKNLPDMIYEKQLGFGAFKKVYLVSINDIQYAMAVEKLTSKGDARDEIRGIKLVQEIQSTLSSSSDAKYFENIHDWWIQTLPVNECKVGQNVFSKENLDSIQLKEKIPKSFIGKNWYLISIKTLYDMDLKKFCKRSELKYKIGENHNVTEVDTLCNIALNEENAVRLLYQVCHAGRILHDQFGIVHRDIKPKNIMLKGGNIVLIDYGFARKADTVDGKLCIVENGILRGEVKYVEANDVALYRGCTNGDTYAMGKTMYEFFFCEFDNGTDTKSDRVLINVENAKHENEVFRKMLMETTPKYSRFEMSIETRGMILEVLRGLCNETHPISFNQAERKILI